MHAFGPARRWGNLQERLAHLHGDPASKIVIVVLTHLERDDRPFVLGCAFAELIEQHRLSDPAEAGDDHRLFCPASREPGKQQHERIQLIVTSDQKWRCCARIGRVWISEWVHSMSISGLCKTNRA